VGQTDNFEIYGGPHFILHNKVAKYFV